MAISGVKIMGLHIIACTVREQNILSKSLCFIIELSSVISRMKS